MKLWESFDLASLLVGLLLGAIVGMLLRISTLKKLSLDIQKIGLNLGVEGFEDKQSSGFHIGGNVGGDVAGRDMNKDQRSFKNTSDIYNAINQLKSDSATKIRSSTSIRASDPSSGFIEILQSLQRQGGDWTAEWIETCLRNAVIKSQIDRKMQELSQSGWVVSAVSFDNIQDGVHVRFELEKKY